MKQVKVKGRRTKNGFACCLRRLTRKNEIIVQVDDVVESGRVVAIVIKQAKQMRRVDEQFVLCGQKYKVMAALSVQDGKWKATVRRERGWYECSDAHAPSYVSGKPGKHYAVVLGERDG